jgi:pyruvate/2-oxoglutarate/acetoin dehydrogenase E1 component
MTTVLKSLNTALYDAMASDLRVFILGEDILDPYGGAFKVTSGLSTAYPGRVLSTPVSEAGITGLAAGMALRGIRPVVEIMFGDFITLVADQLINHIAKFPVMYNQKVTVPMVIRTPMGGRRGYGPTHSQSLEKLFLGVPGLRTLAPCHFLDPGRLLSHAILFDDAPVLFIENKLLYQLEVVNPQSLTEFTSNWHDKLNPFDQEEKETSPNLEVSGGSNPTSIDYAPDLSLTIRDAPEPKITLATYGFSGELALKAIEILAYQYELFAELVIITQLAPMTIDPILDSVSRTGRLLVIEEGTLSFSWGSEVVARIAETLGSRLEAAGRLACRDLPIPASPTLESGVLPDVKDIIQSVRKMLQ